MDKRNKEYIRMVHETTKTLHVLTAEMLEGTEKLMQEENIEPTDEAKMEEEIIKILSRVFKNPDKRTLQCHYLPKENTLYIDAYKEDFDPNFLKYVLEAQDLPKDAEIVFTKINN